MRTASEGTSLPGVLTETQIQESAMQTVVLGIGLNLVDKPDLAGAAHTPVPGRHAHRERTIHTEASPGDAHADED